MKTFFTKKNKRTGGFTLVETIVAIGIFTFSLLGLIVVLGKGIADTDYAKAKNTSAYLAQEGIEYVRNMRDTFMLYDSTPATGWADFTAKLTAGGCFGANGCYINADAIFTTPERTPPLTYITFTSCGSTCTQLLYDASSGKYDYPPLSGVNSGFTRKIKVSSVTTDQIRISSTVYWAQGTNTYNITFSDDLYNWIQ
jgi:type II secretory pathway pseudopilin PulG